MAAEAGLVYGVTMTDSPNWEIPAWGDPEPEDKSDFLSYRWKDGTWDSPLYLWRDGDSICISGISDANEYAELRSAQDVDDLIKRLERAKRDVFGSDE